MDRLELLAAESVLVDGWVAGAWVARMANPDRAAAATLGLLPLPSAIFTRLTVGTVVRERRGEVSVCGNRFSEVGYPISCSDEDYTVLRPVDVSLRFG